MPPADNHPLAAFLFLGEVQGSLHVHLENLRRDRFLTVAALKERAVC
jgi:hypothetical protein